MLISRNIQFNFTLVILYGVYWLASKIGANEIANTYVALISVMIGWMYSIIGRVIALSFCRSYFGVQTDEITHNTHQRQISYLKTKQGLDFDDSLPTPWRLVKLWDQIGLFIPLYYSSMIYFMAFGFLIEYTKNAGDWGYDWFGAFVGTIVVCFGIFIGGLSGILSWIRRPVVWVFDQ